MAVVTTQTISNGALTTPSAVTPGATDTIARGQFGPNGVLVRIITTGTATTLTVSDPTSTGLGNAGTLASQVAPATGARMAYIPVAAISPSADTATLNYSGALTGVTCEYYRI